MKKLLLIIALVLLSFVLSAQKTNYEKYWQAREDSIAKSQTNKDTINADTNTIITDTEKYVVINNNNYYDEDPFDFSYGFYPNRFGFFFYPDYLYYNYAWYNPLYYNNGFYWGFRGYNRHNNWYGNHGGWHGNHHQDSQYNFHHDYQRPTYGHRDGQSNTINRRIATQNDNRYAPTYTQPHMRTRPVYNNSRNISNNRSREINNIRGIDRNTTTRTQSNTNISRRTYSAPQSQSRNYNNNSMPSRNNSQNFNRSSSFGGHSGGGSVGRPGGRR
jgi:hypothetical protein